MTRNFCGRFWGHLTMQHNKIQTIGSSVQLLQQAPMTLTDNRILATGAGAQPTVGSVRTYAIIGETEQSVDQPGS